jgi:catechol 2,3-dioxygenase-like lactoylglutathione lyase family enzyme
MIDIRGMAPLLSVFDMPASIHFYCDKLGFQIAGSDQKPAPDFDWVLLRLNGVEVMLNTAYEKPERPATRDPVRIAAHEDVCLYFSSPDVDAVYAHLKAVDVKCNPPRVAPYGMKQLYVTDPDGYMLCFQWKA